jgi:hypothetical protein
MKSILVMILFFVGAALAAPTPTEVEQRIAYTSSLNSMASIVMNWYGSLITSNEAVSFTTMDGQWDKYRSQYPDDISQIHITSTDLTKLDNSDKYQFKVNALIAYHSTKGEHSELISETFIFQVSALAKPVIKSITRDKTEQSTTVHTAEFNRSYYKAREFAYAWLAYLDGVEMMKPTLYAEQWLDKATYSMEIGDKKEQGSVSSTLVKRQQYLSKGGHLLRSLDVKPIEGKPNIFILDLILEWKGVNQVGKPVLAKIHQQIEYEILENNSWQVQSIKEQHLLPDIAPWVELLC